MSIERKTLTALRWTAGTRLVGQAATWVVTLALVRILAPSDYGLMAIVSVVMAVSTSLAELGLGASLVQARRLEPALLARVAGFVWLLHLGLGALLVAASRLAGWAFADARLTPLFQTAALQFVFIALGAVPQALASRALDFKWLSRVEFITAVSTSLATLTMALYGFGVWALVLGNVLGSATRAGLLVSRGENVWPDFRLRGIGSHLDFGAKYSGGNLAWILVNQADVLVGSRMMSKAALGVYSVSLHLATLPMQKMMSVINQVAFPAVARLQDDPERLKRRLLQACSLLTTVSVPVLWGLAAVAPEFVAIVLGAKWAAATRTLQMVTLVVPLRMVSGLFNTAVAGVGRAGTALRNTVITAVVWPGCFLIGAFWGAEGLAASWLVAIPATFLLNFPRTSASLGVAFGDVVRTLVRPVLAGLAMVAAIGSARLVVGEWAVPWRSATLIAVGSVAYLVTITLIHRDVWRQLRQIVFHRGGDA